MTEINFTSTYRIPISQPGINAAKKAKLKELIQSYPNGLIGNSKVGNARVSISDNEDANFIRKLKTIGYKIYQKFEGENIEKNQLDIYIKERLDNREYSQLGKNMKRMGKELKEKRRFERNYTPSFYESEKTSITTKTSNITEDTKLNSTEQIKTSEEYIRYKNEYGEEFANAVFFEKH